jgi:glycosyltransferase involved in cell wall biosynthesis
MPALDILRSLRTPSGKAPRVALVHEWLISYAGSEKVLEQMCAMFPDAEIFCVVADPAAVRDWPFLRGRTVRTSFVQRLPSALKRYRHYLALMPLAIEQHDLSDFDVVISSSHAVAKGVLTGPNQLHVSYVHSPMRYAWDLQHRYLAESRLEHGLKTWIVRWMLHRLRLWDHRTAAGVDHFVANSRFIARRIRRVYRRDSEVIYPPVDIAGFGFEPNKESFYVAASRMVPYKRMDLIVRAFAQMPERRLVVIGEGPDMPKVAAAAAGAPNVQLLGYQPFAELRSHLARARAFVFAAEEDFGILPVEAQACGTPVIAYGQGGVRESIVATGPAPTGVLFEEQTVEAIRDAVDRFEALERPIRPEDCRLRAERFSAENFRDRLATTIAEHWRALMAEL